MDSGMEMKVSLIIMMIGFVVTLAGVLLKKRGHSASLEVKEDPRFINYMKRADFFRNFGILLAVTMFAVMILPIYFGYIGFGAMGLYILAYSMHISSGIPYKRIVFMQALVVVIAVVSIYMLVSSK